MSINIPRWYFTVLAGLLILAGLYATSLYSYLLFHSIAELFSIIVAFGIFIIAWNSRRFLDNNYLVFIGIAYFFVGAIDLIHTLAYTGMGVFPEYGTNLAAQLWLVARYAESISLLVAPLLISRRLHVNLTFVLYGLVAAFLLLLIFYRDIFPVCFIEGSGLTLFKRTSEYVISAILLGAIYLMILKRKEFDAGILKLLIAAIVITIGSELTFTLYRGAFEFPNLIGHFLKIASFYLIYKAIIETGLVKPYNLLFRNLKHSEEQYRAMYEEAPNAYLLIGTNGYVEQANKRAEELLGYSQDNIKGQPVFDFYADTPEGKAKTQELFQRFLAGEEIRNEELQMRRADGTRVWTNISLRSIHNDKGNVVAGRLEIADISEHKKLDQMKDDFISLVSHELRSPMTVITGAVNTALTEADRLSPEETRQLLEDASLEAEMLSKILGNLLELSRIQAARLFLHNESINVEKVIQEAINEVERQSSGHRFIVDLPKKQPMVYADELRLERILYNLLENATKYSPPGSDVRVSIKQRKDDVVIGISDEGKGLSQQEQEKLFLPFQQLEESGPDRTRGVGLGLLVCQRLVEAHGGQIWVESESGHGSTFYFTMPLSKSKQ